MTRLETIAQNLACHIHSDSTQRIAKAPFVEGISKADVQWLLDELIESQFKLKHVIADLRDANELLKPSKIVDVTKEIQNLKAVIADKDATIGRKQCEIEDRDALLSELRRELEKNRQPAPPLMRWIWERIHNGT